ncbi:MAG TPA: di-heme oxidoredictase family protein, partial [Bryobacteraceae bacterium]|nr:di-heme oxidoredictase family protein [Bryobacteraceae bacterium]
CHTPTLQTGNVNSPALSNRPVPLYSDLALHNMGRGLVDGINQGIAVGGDWRSAPLWGLGQRLFFLHDGRTSDLVQAIQAHGSPGSEATQVVNAFNGLPEQAKQDLLHFLRSL